MAMEENMRKEARIGLVFLACYILLSRFMVLPSILLGLILGISVVHIVLGLLPKRAYETVLISKKRIIDNFKNKTGK